MQKKRHLSLSELPLDFPQSLWELPIQKRQQQQDEGSVHAADAVGHDALK